MRLDRWKPGEIALAALGLAYLIMWVGGVGSYVFYGRPPLDAPWAASVFLLLAGLLTIGGSEKSSLPSLLLAAAMGFASEIIGVHFGVLYGEYFYTDILEPQILRVPVVMICAWLVLLSYTLGMLRQLELPTWGEALAGAGWMTAIDLIIDPLAANELGYWRWLGPGRYYGVPIQNFAGWFLVSWVIFLSIRRRQPVSQISMAVGFTIVLFFTIIAMALGKLIPGVVGVILCAAHGRLIRGTPTSAARSA